MFSGCGCVLSILLCFSDFVVFSRFAVHLCICLCFMYLYCICILYTIHINNVVIMYFYIVSLDFVVLRMLSCFLEVVFFVYFVVFEGFLCFKDFIVL